MAPKFLPALDQTLELEEDVMSTNSPPPVPIGLGKDLEERTGKLRNPTLGSEGLGWGRALPSKLRRSSCRCPPPWSHSPPPHPGEARSGAPASRAMQWGRPPDQCPSVASPGGETALHCPISLVRLGLELAHTGSVIRSGSSILYPTVIIQWWCRGPVS
jgi:hypothetical protein